MVNRYSRYQNTPKTIYKGGETHDVWRRPAWLRRRPEENRVRQFMVPSHMENRPDLIANKVYGSSYLSWVIIAFNAAHGDVQARTTLNWPKAGQIIEYPEESLIYTELF